MEIKVTGLDDIMRNLATYESNLNIKLGQAIEGASQIIENKAKQLCPVDDGILRASITHKVINGQGEVMGKVGTNVEYAPYVHQGTGIHAAKGDGRKDPWSYQTPDGKWHTTVGQKPQPFLEDAAKKSKGEIRKKVKEVMSL